MNKEPMTYLQAQRQIRIIDKDLETRRCVQALCGWIGVIAAFIMSYEAWQICSGALSAHSALGVVVGGVIVILIYRNEVAIVKGMDRVFQLKQIKDAQYEN